MSFKDDVEKGTTEARRHGGKESNDVSDGGRRATKTKRHGGKKVHADYAEKGLDDRHERLEKLVQGIARKKAETEPPRIQPKEEKIYDISDGD